MLKNTAVLGSVPANPLRSMWRTVGTALAGLPVLLLFFVCSAAAYSSFFAKWGFCGTTESGDCMLQQMIEGTARRPWVYRRLLPELASWLDSHMPGSIHGYLLQALQNGNLGLHYASPIAATAEAPEMLLTFYCIYVLSLLAFFGAALLLWRIGTHLTSDKVASALAALIFVLAFPIFLTVGGNFYDFTELFFFALASWIALTQMPYWLILLAPVATYNKESFFFFLVTLYPVLVARFGWRRSAGWLSVAVLASGVAYWWVKSRYIGNPGGMVEFHLSDHIEYFRRFRHYGQFEFQYGMLAPRGFNIINILLVVLLVRSGFKRLPTAMRRQIQLALVINVPLFLLFCYPGELRNLSMLYLGLVAMLACALSHWLSGFYRSRPPTPLNGG